MAITTLDQLIATAQTCPDRVVAVAAAHEKSVLEATVAARKQGIATPVYVGHTAEIESLLRELGEDPAAYTMVQADSDEDCAAAAVALAAEGKADFGFLGTWDKIIHDAFDEMIHVNWFEMWANFAVVKFGDVKKILK